MASYGLFGKLPALGDFVARGLAGDDLRRIDDWLARGMLALQSSSAQWLDSYLVSPVWQCLIPAGRLCSEPCAAAVMPSVDRVGRYFPLLAVRALPPPSEAAALIPELAIVAASLPAALHEQLGPDLLLERLAQPNPRPVAAPDGERLLAESPADHPDLPLVVGAGAGPAAEPLLIALEGLPQVRERLQSMTRVNDRRWDIELMSGAIVALPEHGAADALARLERLQTQHALLDRSLSQIDMRVPHRMAVRVHPTLAGGPRMLLGGA